MYLGANIRPHLQLVGLGNSFIYHTMYGALVSLWQVELKSSAVHRCPVPVLLAAESEHHN